MNDGGPAFPQNDAEVNRINNYDGMTLRDYFAAKVMEGFIAQGAAADQFNYFHDDEAKRNLSIRSYKIADAMLKARARNGPRS